MRKSIFLFSLLSCLFVPLSQAATGDEAIAKHKEGNFEEAAKIAQEACESNDAKGCFYLGFKLQQESKLEQANVFYEKACGLNFAVGCLSLANNFRQGLGLKKDNQAALQFYSRACELGEKLACSHIKK